MSFGLGPHGTRPHAALRVYGIGPVTIEMTSSIEARMSNPLSEIVSDPRKRLVFAITLTAQPLDE